MAIISEMQEEKPLSLPLSASFDPSNPLGFLDQVLDFVGKESNFLLKDSAEKELAAAVTATKERLSEAEKKKLENETVKPMEIEKPKKESLKPKEEEKPKKEEFTSDSVGLVRNRPCGDKKFASLLPTDSSQRLLMYDLAAATSLERFRFSKKL